MLTGLPLIILLFHFFQGPGEMWSHIQRYLLPTYLSNSLWVLVGTLFLSSLLGVSTAWVLSFHRLPARRLLHMLMFLPLAVPTYIMAFAWAGLTERGGLVHQLISGLSGHSGENPLLLDIMHIPGLCWVLSLSLFPYVYFPVRRGFDHISQEQLELGELLGKSRWGFFRKIVISLVRPAWISGAFLVAMEVLSDYGAAKYFGVNTLTTGIFRAWFGLEDSASALFLSVILLIGVVGIFFVERFFRGIKQYQGNTSNRNLRPVRGLRAVLFTAVPLLVLFVSFVLPVLQLSGWAAHASFNTEILVVTRDSLALALLSALIICAVAFALIKSTRWNHYPLVKKIAPLATSGYTIPGAVIAIAVSLLALNIDRNLSLGGVVLYGTVPLLIYAYLFRFLAVAYHPLQASDLRLASSYSSIAQLMGKSRWRILCRIDWPLLRWELLGVYSLVFLEILKELPLSLILKPYAIDTLAIRTYQYASDEMLNQAAIPGLMIIASATVILLALNKKRIASL